MFCPRFCKRRGTLFILWLSWLAVEVLSPWRFAGCTSMNNKSRNILLQILKMSTLTLVVYDRSLKINRIMPFPSSWCDWWVAVSIRCKCIKIAVKYCDYIMSLHAPIWKCIKNQDKHGSLKWSFRFFSVRLLYSG